MKLIFLHGPPASGKYTIAKELQKRLDCGIFHNHLTIDTVKPIFEFGTDNFWSLVDNLRITCLEAAAQHLPGILLYTSCYDHPTDLSFFEKIEQVIQVENSELLPVYLKCAVNELEARVSNESRINMAKVSTVKGLQKCLTMWNCAPVPRDNCITVVTTGKTPTQCAEEIINSLHLI